MTWLGAAAWLDFGERSNLPPAQSTEGRFDAIVVLGCRVNEEGVASASLTRRAQLGAELLLAGHGPLLILTGGVGENAPSEARAAMAIALSAGAPREAILLEEQSTSTEENASYAANLVDVSRVLVVTDGYHTFRARRVFERHFEHVSATGCRGSLSQRLRGALREVPAICAYWLRGRL